MLRLSLCFAFLAAIAPCQVEEVGEPDVRAVEGERGRPGKEGSIKGEVPEENLTPEQRIARNAPTSGASAYCRFSVSVSPPKLLPGQSGTLKVLAALQGNTVMPAPAPMELVAPAQQGALTLGPMVAQPAALGRLAAAYLGRPVYDNYAIFELPVTMAADAAMGSKHIASVDMKFDLYDGASAQPINRFLDRVALEIEVGRVPDPAVQGFAASAAEPPEPVTKPANVQAPTSASSPTEPSPLVGNVVVPDNRPEPSSAADAPTELGDGPAPVVQPSAGLPMPLLVGGAALLLVVGMLLRRK
ncbi:MAG: hypothetical protein FJ301_13280 [Planctomycetes bacterium]|nr:hypothetical protein [Planctomycetota bacterium]